jgi:tRNA (cmo5U34)-methyltransferase
MSSIKENNNTKQSTTEQPEKETMASFFDLRAEGYEEHMKLDPDFDHFYTEAVVPIPETLDPIAVLDLGCGTGLELKGLFERAPNARVTCLDLSSGMLDKLRKNYHDRLGQLTIVQASYVDWQYPDASFDFALSVNTMHHFLQPKKVGIYQKIRASLKPGGTYIEADYMVDAAAMERGLQNYHKVLAHNSEVSDGTYHLDIPFTPDVQRGMLMQAGFAAVHTVLERIQAEWSGAVLIATK